MQVIQLLNNIISQPEIPSDMLKNVNFFLNKWQKTENVNLNNVAE